MALPPPVKALAAPADLPRRLALMRTRSSLGRRDTHDGYTVGPRDGNPLPVKDVDPLKLPDYLIIGAMKTGTSSVHRYLCQHPAVFPSKSKELDFFTTHYRRGLGWYMQNFRGDVSGEASPNYMKLHLWPKTAARIREHVPNARLLCVLRNPIDRTLSHYLHNVWRGRESRPFSVAVRPDSNFVMTSRYSWQLDHYLNHFPSEQLLLVTTEELDRSPDRTMSRILQFVGVDDAVAIDTSKRHNVTNVKLAAAGAPVPADPAISVADRIRLTADARAGLAAEFRPDVERLKSVWPEFPGWQL